MKIFNCKKCGDCCKGYGGTYVTHNDIKAIAKYTETTPDRFVADYCQLSGGKLLLAQSSNGYCIFWDKICTIHPVKPRMCGEWPFIKSVLTDAVNWRIMASSCPGMSTDTEDEVIKEVVSREITNHKFQIPNSK